jgi:hypothetical protein
VALPFELGVRQVDAVDREDGPHHRLSRPGQQVPRGQVVTAGSQRVPGLPAGERLLGQRLLDQGPGEPAGKAIGPGPPGGDQAAAEQRPRPLQRGQASPMSRYRNPCTGFAMNQDIGDSYASRLW